ncbi:MAG: hypothetical protein KatS3mg114_1126 [Planctomycetaceae bacterium]|nr:MAG: hypothetical protein KatS3mg114_1126 [Planctomycetaceae bacterium]
MNGRRAVLERQLKLAEETLARVSQKLQAQGCAQENWVKHPDWRRASALCTHLRRRLTALGKVEAITAELVRRKAEAAQVVEEPKPKKREKAVASEQKPAAVQAKPKATPAAAGKKAKKG